MQLRLKHQARDALRRGARLWFMVALVWIAIVIGLVLLPFIEKFIRLYIALPLKHRGDPSPVTPQLIDLDPSNFPPYVAQPSGGQLLLHQPNAS